jgi:putative nucleotidyltransferase with HDIG domain
MTRTFRIYVVFMTLLAAAGLAASGWSVGADAGTHWNAFASLLVLGFASEAYYFRLRVGQAETQSSVSFIPFIASYILLDTGWAAVVAGSSMFAVELAVRRKSPIKILFNSAQMTLSVAVAATVYRSLGGVHSLDSFSFAFWPLAASVCAYFGVNSTAVTIAVVLDLRQRLWDAWRRIAGVSLVYDLFTSMLAAALAYFFVLWQIPGLLAVTLPIWFVRHLYQVSLQLEQVNRDLLELMVKAIEARDPYTSGHSQRVAALAEMLAREIGLSTKLVGQIRTAALLHDVGKIHEQYAPLLRKDGRLDGTEQALMQTHSTRSAELVATISGFRGVIEAAVRHHHENYDGSGYPAGLSANAIPVGARIIMIADTIDAMTTDRPYRSALNYEKVVSELRKYSGKQFDPVLVDLVISSDALRSFASGRAAPIPTPSQRLPWREPAPGRQRLPSGAR